MQVVDAAAQGAGLSVVSAQPAETVSGASGQCSPQHTAQPSANVTACGDAGITADSMDTTDCAVAASYQPHPVEVSGGTQHQHHDFDTMSHAWHIHKQPAVA